MKKTHLEKQPRILSSDHKNIQWHPPFCASMHLELVKYKEILEYFMEYGLNTKPLLIDLMVIKKAKNITIDNEIGRIFKTYNIIEYKSPYAGLSIDDFTKAIARAYLFKASGETEDAIDSFEITVTFVRARKPVALMKMLREDYGVAIEKRTSGIYVIKEPFLGGVQIVVTRELDFKEHIWLTSLDDGMKEEAIWELLNEAGKLTNKDDREYADAVLQIAMEKNKNLFARGKERQDMCQAFWELFAPEIEAEKKISEKRGEQATLISLIIKKVQRGKDILSISDALEAPVDVIRPIYEAVLSMPGADAGQIYEKLYSK